ncbi:MAG TPA: hypothetical protein PKB02_13150 [Anaerohalosphaeraceae bacterium]|nr:hypothetical protein [Anaerohalosphaeraceae bacterium]
MRYSVRELHKRIAVLELASRELDPANLPELCILVRHPGDYKPTMTKSVNRYEDGTPFSISGYIHIPETCPDSTLDDLRRKWQAMEAK